MHCAYPASQCALHMDITFRDTGYCLEQTNWPNSLDRLAKQLLHRQAKERNCACETHLTLRRPVSSFGLFDWSLFADCKMNSAIDGMTTSAQSTFGSQGRKYCNWATSGFHDSRQNRAAVLVRRVFPASQYLQNQAD